MPQDWSWVTTEMFDRAVREIAAGLDVLDIPGVWEIVAEELNNDALDLLASERGYGLLPIGRRHDDDEND